jgi:hypothetical protein
MTALMGRGAVLKQGWLAGLAGAQLLLASSASGQSTNAAWLHTANRLNTPHFWSAVDASNGPVTVLAFGDSMADPGRSVQRELFTMLKTKLGNAGDSWIAYGYPSNGAAIVDPSTTGLLPPWWSFYFALPPGSSVEWVQRDISYVNQVGLYWFAHPDGGQFTLTIATNLTSWSPPLLQLDGWASSTEMRYTNLAVPLARYKVGAQDIGGTNYLLAPEFKDTAGRGIHVAYLSRGGINLNRIFSYPTNLTASLIATLNPQLVVNHMKELSDLGATNLSARLYDLESLWRTCVTNGDVAYIGTPYDFRDAAGEHTGTENLVWREAALRDGRAYLDCMTPCVSYAAMTNAGWLDYPLDVHPNVIGNQALARAIWPELGFFALRAPRQLELLPVAEGVACRWSSVTNLEYELQSSMNLLEWNSVVVAPGTGGVMSWTNELLGGGRYYRLSLAPH